MNRLYFLLISLPLILSCNPGLPIPDPRSEAVLAADAPCLRFNLKGAGRNDSFDYIKYFRDRDVISGVFNPLNEREIIYVTKINDILKYQLRYRHLDTGEDRLLDEGLVWTAPDWSPQGWIVYSKANKIWKVHSDGGDPIQLTWGFDNHSVWSPDGKRIYFVGDSGDPGLQKVVRVRSMNIYGENIQKIDAGPAYFAISLDGKWLVGQAWYYPPNPSQPGMSKTFVGLYHIPTGQMLGITDTTGSKDRRYFAWHPNGEEVYWTSYNDGLYMTHIPTRTTRLVREGCSVGGSRLYNFVTVSPSGKYLMLGRDDAYQHGKRQSNGGRIYRQVNLVLIDLQTDEETVLEL